MPDDGLFFIFAACIIGVARLPTRHYPVC